MQIEAQRADHVRRAIASIPAGAAIIVLGLLLLDAYFPGGLQGYFDSLAAILEQAMASGAGF